MKEEKGVDLNRQCLDFLARKKVVAWRSNNSPTWDRFKECFRKFIGRKGVSDLLGIYKQEAKLWNGKTFVFGVMLCVETKAGTDRLSKEQKAFADDIREAGGIYLVVRKIGDLVDAMAALEKENADLGGGPLRP